MTDNFTRYHTLYSNRRDQHLRGHLEDHLRLVDDPDQAVFEIMSCVTHVGLFRATGLPADENRATLRDVIDKWGLSPFAIVMIDVYLSHFVRD
jgi:hypothetical protein